MTSGKVEEDREVKGLWGSYEDALLVNNNNLPLPWVRQYREYHYHAHNMNGRNALSSTTVGFAVMYACVSVRSLRSYEPFGYLEKNGL